MTLTPWGRAGLVALSTLLSLVWLAATRALTAHRARVTRIALGLVAFWAFVIVSPQAYYLYFHLLFEIPTQWVIRWRGPSEIATLLSFRASPSLSHHSQGLLGWALIAGLPMLPRRKPLPPPA